jgi:hypothetical protein
MGFKVGKLFHAIVGALIQSRHSCVFLAGNQVFVAGFLLQQE